MARYQIPTTHRRTLVQDLHPFQSLNPSPRGPADPHLGYGGQALARAPFNPAGGGFWVLNRLRPGQSEKSQKGSLARFSARRPARTPWGLGRWRPPGSGRGVLAPPGFAVLGPQSGRRRPP
ncbi:hypothetical protein NL676_038043 [Syzygium grande]|nr:hypothetical protein NL676_038043 [Syzygium grande]